MMSSSSTLLPLTPPPTPTKSLQQPRGSSVNYDKNVQSMQRLRHSMIGDDDLFDEFTSSSSSSLPHQNAHSQEHQHQQHPNLEHHHSLQDTIPEDAVTTNILPDGNNEIKLSRSKQRDQRKPARKTERWVSSSSCILSSLGQVPAIVLIGMFHLMIGIPFGVSYFPIGWASSTASSSTSSTSYENTTNSTYSINNTVGGMAAASNDEQEDGVSLLVGTFPLTSGKEALGIRMFLFATMIGQVVYVFRSGFVNPIGLQMVENVPFCHALARLCISHQGFGMPALSTLLFLFGLSSVLVGIVFFLLGYLELGRIVYYFPNHVLIGLIAGIGVFLAKTALEITMAAEFSLHTISQSWHLVHIVFGLEVLLRLLDRFLRLPSTGKPYCSLLSPLYFCSITPCFYIVLALLRVPIQDAMDAGYFFPPIDAGGGGDAGDSSQNGRNWMGVPTSDLLDMWRIVDFRTISWQAVGQAIPTLISLILFSLIHVPINIPAFALSTNTDVDMNVELIAHGYSNIISGLAGGLQNYMAYTQSVIYAKSGGTGKVSGIVVAIVTLILFVIGPMVASYIPRCMAGTLLLHVGIDLFLEGVYDSFHRFDWLEYTSVWLIIVVMTVYGMDAAMIAGLLTAIFTFVAQNMTYVDPLRGAMSAATLRSDVWNRHHDALSILENVHTGRSRILVIQLQGNLFFGNMAHFTKAVMELLQRTRSARKFKKEVAAMPSIAENNNDNIIRGVGRVNDSFQEHPLVVILDFSLVLGIDSSAAQAMTRLKNNMREQFHVELSIFVSGSPNGFPCAVDLSKELTTVAGSAVASSSSFYSPDESTCLLQDEQPLKSSSFHQELAALLAGGSQVAETLNLALAYAENFLIARENPDLLDEYTMAYTMTTNTEGVHRRQLLPMGASLSDEHEVALEYLNRLSPHDVERRDCETLFSKFERETYHQGEFLWRQGSKSASIKLVLQGTLISILENEAGTNETISAGNTIGELGLVTGISRLSSIQCLTEDAIVYSLSREAYNELLQSSPHVARLLDLICIRYLSARVQHVSNRVYETRCLPI